MKYKNIVVLTGAGISAESGIKTFRDADGLWENHRVEEVATPEGFLQHPERVYRFYNQRRQQLISPEIQPNAAHYALAKLAAHCSGDVTLVTQNVDDLHERAGSHKVLHMHGELKKARCIQSGEVIIAPETFDSRDICSCCKIPSSIRPHIVWFGEMPLYMDEISEKLQQADLFIAIGTSGHVYPAAGFVDLASRYGAHCVELNLEPGMGASLFDEAHYGPATDVVQRYVTGLLEA